MNPIASTSNIAMERSSSDQASRGLFPNEIVLSILKLLDFDDLANTRVTCRTWEVLSTEVIQEKVGRFAFGKAKWEKYFGDVGEEPPLPPSIGKILTSYCPFWTGEQVWETHMLTLIPKTVNGVSLTLDSLGKFIQSPKTGYKTQYRYYYNYVNIELGNKGTPPHWVLMTRDAIPGSRSKSYSDQKALVAQHANQGYQLPHALDAAVSILMEHVKTGKRLYSDSPYTLTSCQESVDNNQWPVVIGAFAADGLGVYDFIGRDDVGVGCSRKFCVSSV